MERKSGLVVGLNSSCDRCCYNYTNSYLRLHYYYYFYYYYHYVLVLLLLLLRFQLQFLAITSVG